MGDPRNTRGYLEYKSKLGFCFVHYCTLDGLPIHPQWLEYLKYVNLLISMTSWARQEFRKIGLDNVAMIHHGLNWDWWKVTEEEKREARLQLGIPEDSVIFINWDVPQHRKRPDALLRCWKTFIEKGDRKDKCALVLYSDWEMANSLGWNIEDLIKQYNVPRDTVISPIELQGTPKFWQSAESPEQLKSIVKIGDIFCSTTSGEGSGKCSLEALGMGMPVVITDYSACSEVCAKGSILVPCYEGRAGRFRMDDNRRSVEAGVVNEERFVEAMEMLYEDEGERRRLGNEAREWSRTFDYDEVVVPSWKKLLHSLDVEQIMAKELLNL